jgi:hypothetical protein
MTTKIFLVMVDPKTEAETHMEWEGHDKLEDAMREYAEIRNMSMKEGIKPIDGYVYEAEQPPFGIKAEKLDMAKFASFFENTIMSESMNNSYSYDVVQ